VNEDTGVLTITGGVFREFEPKVIPELGIKKLVLGPSDLLFLLLLSSRRRTRAPGPSAFAEEAMHAAIAKTASRNLLLERMNMVDD
jgi:hypothetical protein